MSNQQHHVKLVMRSGIEEYLLINEDPFNADDFEAKGYTEGWYAPMYQIMDADEDILSDKHERRNRRKMKRGGYYE